VAGRGLGRRWRAGPLLGLLVLAGICTGAVPGENAFSDRPSISIHVYGANIGAVRRHVYDAASGTPREFISGYHNTVMPNLWDCSKEAG